eukprot:2334442-Pleurochrysis_carterae.AAC.4
MDADLETTVRDHGNRLALSTLGHAQASSRPKERGSIAEVFKYARHKAPDARLGIYRLRSEVSFK